MGELGALPVALAGGLGSLVAGLMTGVGALPAFFAHDWARRRQVILLGMAAGVMLAATAFSLILPGLESARESLGSSLAAAAAVAVGILAGAWFVWALHERVPHEHFVKGREGAGGDPARLARLWLFIFAITLHNFPEGLSVGVGYAVGPENGLSITLGIGLQNMPEGLAVAAALIAEGYDKARAFWVALFTGLVEPVGGLVGAATVSISSDLLPWGLAFSAGAMLFVISGEIIPETHRKGISDKATFALVVGFIVMMSLDVLLG
ncbi:MAG: ZIP family metal transporter [Rhodovibrionaceae bacterium]|nr:ZIP family metal transporter [Rhodovibrionaceae bacterium]